MPQSPKSTQSTLTWVARALWLLLLAGGAGITQSSLRAYLDGAAMTAHATGEVVALADAPDYQHTSYYYPKVKFFADGEELTFVGSLEKPAESYRVGQKLDVVYAPGEPYRARLAENDFGAQHWFELLLGVGMLCAALALAARAAVRWRATPRRGSQAAK